jgi:hypothetical protein
VSARALALVAALAGTAAAEPTGALTAGSELALTGDGPAQRVNAAATIYLTRRLGLRAGLHRATLDAERGVAVAGVAYRAAAARPRLELVLDLGAGVARPLGPAAVAGVTNFLWPTRWPVAITATLHVYALADGNDRAPLAITIGAGLAIAR